jgi:hypothetical protein
MERRTAEVFRKFASTPGRLNQKNFESMLKILDIWLKKLIYDKQQIESLVEDLKKIFNKAEEERRASNAKSKRVEINQQDFQHLIF